MYAGAGDEIEAGSAECLAVIKPIPDFTTLIEENSTFESLVRRSLVETGLTSPAQDRTRTALDHDAALWSDPTIAVFFR